MDGGSEGKRKKRNGREKITEIGKEEWRKEWRA